MTPKDTTGKPARIQDLFNRGKEFTEEVIQENEKLRLLVTKLETEKRDIETQFVRVDVSYIQQKLAVLEEETRRLKEENQTLRDRFSNIEDENRKFSERYVEVEKQNSDLISLYVASYNLHATLQYEPVVSAIKETVINLIGSERFGIYLFDGDGEHLDLVDGMGLEEWGPKVLSVDEPLVHEMMISGAPVVDLENGGNIEATPPSQIACVPLKLGEDVIGVIAIYGLLVQKEHFEDLDFELFDLLGTHAGAAIFSARILRDKRKLSDIVGIMKGE